MIRLIHYFQFFGSISFFVFTHHPAVSANVLGQLDAQMEGMKDSLIYQSKTGFFYVEGGVQLDATAYNAERADGNSPGFFFLKPGREVDGSLRLTVTADVWMGERLFGFLKGRWDDGVHPGVSRFYGDATDVRLDEFFLRYRVAGDALQIQAGQFVPILGNFLNRQDNWDMGLISYPAMYEQVTSVSDQTVPASADAFAARREALDFPNKLTWLPAYWAQLYTRGVALFGNQGPWDYSLNFTNRAASSRGAVWEENDWSRASYMGSLGYRFNPAWRIGLTGAYGPYLQDSAKPALPAGARLRDFKQRNIGLDVTWQRGHWSIWSEFVHTRFEVPNVGDAAEFFSYFIETRYAFRPQWWASARWNHQIYNTIATSEGSQNWDNDHYRIDLGLGHRPSRRTQVKLQYSYQRQDASFQNAENFVALEWSLRL